MGRGFANPARNPRPLLIASPHEHERANVGVERTLRDIRLTSRGFALPWRFTRIAPAPSADESRSSQERAAASARPSPRHWPTPTHDDLDRLDDDLFDQIMQTNVRGPFATIRVVRALLDAGDGGVVVNISSVAARMANGSNVAYCASKAALDNMTASLARALAPGIRVYSVAPGLVDTELTRDWAPERRDLMIARTPLGRLATPQDCADAVLAAVTSLRSTTGVVIPVDGGFPLG